MVIFMTIFWSLNYVAAKVALRSFPPIFYSALRMIIAGTLMALVYQIWKRGKPEMAIGRWSWRELLFLGVLGIFGIVGNQMFFVLGLSRTSVAHASLVIATTPVLVLAMAWLRGQEHITGRKALGMMLAIGGVAALNLAPGRSAHGASLIGDLTVFACSFSFALFTVFSKEHMRRLGAIPINALGYGVCALMLIPPVIFRARSFDFAAVPPVGWAMLGYMAVFSSVVCYVIYSYALGHMPASRVASYSYAQPFIASLSAWWLLSEPVTPPVAIGGAMVLCGVWLTGRG